jgi:hypothetical protein
MARKGVVVLRSARTKTPCQGGNLHLIRFPPSFKKPQRNHAILSTWEVLQALDEHIIEMPEKRLLVALVKSALADYQALPKEEWRAERTRAMRYSGRAREMILKRIQVAREAWQWLTSPSNYYFSIKYVSDHLGFRPTDLGIR